MDTTDFSHRLRQLSQTLNIEHQVLARDGGVSKATFSNYVHGKKFPRLETLTLWVSKYNVNANWLIAGYGPMFLGGDVKAPVLHSSDDPVIARMKAVVDLLKQANAPDEVIQNAILATLAMKSAPE